MKNRLHTNGWLKMLGIAVVLIGSGGCLGPNPLFSIGTTAINTTIMRLTNMLLDGLLAAG